MGKKLGRKIAAFLIVVTPLQLWLFSHYNNILTEPSTTVPGNAATRPPSATRTVDAKQELATIQQQYPVAALSDDDQSIAYVDSTQTVHLKSLADGSTKTLVQMKAPVVYLKWIGSDRLFVGEKFTSAGVNHLTLATIDTSSPDPRIIKSFTGFGSSVTFKKIAFSPFTNDVYVLLGSLESSYVYHFDTNGTMTHLYLNGQLIQDVEVGATNGVLFFQDHAEGTKNVLLYQSHSWSLIQRNSVILGVVNNDLFYGTLDSNGLVTQVYDYPTTDSPAQSATENATAPAPQNGPPSLVKAFSTPVEATRITVTSQKTIVVTPK